MDINDFENIDEMLSAALKGASDACNAYTLMATQSQKLKEGRKECLLNLSAMKSFATVLTDSSDIINKIDKDI